MRHRLILTALAATFALGGAVSAQSPSPAPSATPFPWATLPPAADDPPIGRLEPNGPPDARTVRQGVVVELWLSPTTVAPGEWVQALVRVTNTRKDAVWTPGGQCWLTTSVTADLSDLYPQTTELSGNAAAFLRRVTRERDLRTTAFTPWPPDVRADATGVTTVALADCAPELGARFLRLGPGRSKDFRFVWYPMGDQDALDSWRRPLPPGRVRVTAAWEDAGHGARPTGPIFTRHPDLIAATADLELTGSDPGFPTPIEIVEAALTDPTFAAWVDADATRESWTNAYYGGWPGPGYPPQPRFAGLAELAPDGIVEVALIQDLPGHPDVMVTAMVDPWTGEVVKVAIQCGNDPCPVGLRGVPSEPSASPSASVAP